VQGPQKDWLGKNTHKDYRAERGAPGGEKKTDLETARSEAQEGWLQGIRTSISRWT